MSYKEKALDCYLGRNGFRKHNCAEAVAEALQEKFPLSIGDREGLKACGGGRAPEGICGALHAARLMGMAHVPQRVEKMGREFERLCGAIKCRDIKALAKTPCPVCVQSAAELLAEGDGP